MSLEDHIKQEVEKQLKERFESQAEGSFKYYIWQELSGLRQLILKELRIEFYSMLIGMSLGVFIAIIFH